MKSKITVKNIISYIQGNILYKIYYSKVFWLIPKYIREQIDFRIAVMNSECYSKGACIHCGCSTTALQMANKVCDGNCYPPMMNYFNWKKFKKYKTYKHKKDIWSMVTWKQMFPIRIGMGIYKNDKLINSRVIKDKKIIESWQ